MRRPSIGAAIGALAGLLLLAGTLRHLGISMAEAGSASLLLGSVLLAWGGLVIGSIGRGVLRRGERGLLALLCGFPLFAAVYELLFLARVPWAFFPLTAVAAIVAVARERRSPSGSETAPGARASAWLWLLVPSILFVLLRWNRAFTDAGDGALAYDHSVDHSLHLGFYWELLRGVPPPELPGAAGLPFPAYHFLSFMPGLLLILSGGASVIAAYHVLVPALKVTLLLGAVYLAVRVRTGDARTAAAALPVAFLLGHAFDARFNERFIVGPPPDFDLIRNEAQGGGLVVWGTIFCLVALSDAARRQVGEGNAQRALLLAGLFAGLSYAFKAQLFLLFGAAFVAAVLFTAWRDKAWSPLLPLAAMALSFGVFSLASRGSGSRAFLEFRPGLFAEMYIYPNLRRDPAGWARGLGRLLESFPYRLGFLLAVPFAVWRVVAFSPLVPAFVGLRVLRPRSAALLDLIAALAFLAALPMGYALSVVSFYRATSPFEFRQAIHGLAFLGAAVSVVSLDGLLRRRGKDAGPLLLNGALAASLVATPWLASETGYVPAHAGITLSSDEQCALLYLREQTPRDATVLSARGDFAGRVNHQAVVAGFAARRSVLEFWEKDVDRQNDRERDIRRFFSTEDAARAEELLRRYRVDYVLESDAHPLRFAKDSLRLVFERGGYRVYRVAGGANPAAPVAPGDAFRRDDGLRCPAPRGF